MTNEELSKLISDTATETYNNNIDYITEHHTKEMELLLSSKEDNVDFNDVISRTITSYLRTSIELSTMNTISVLKCLGVDLQD